MQYFGGISCNPELQVPYPENGPKCNALIKSKDICILRPVVQVQRIIN